MRKESDFYKMIVEVCAEKNINMKSASFDYITELEKNGIKKHMVRDKLGIKFFK